MDILKAFKINIDEFPVNIQGTHDEPLFQANQIAKILTYKFCGLTKLFMGYCFMPEQPQSKQSN